MDTSDKQRKKSQPPQKPRLINTKWVATIMPVSFVLSIVMSYMSNEALGNSGTLLSFVVLFFFPARKRSFTPWLRTGCAVRKRPFG